MKFSKWFYMAAVLPLAANAAELPAPAAEVQIFRNNSAMIRHEVNTKGAAVFTVTGNFSPLEGTLWYSSNVKQIRKTLTETTRKEAVPFTNITATYKNQRVTLSLKGENGRIDKISGTVLDLLKKEQPQWEEMVILKCANGTMLNISRSQIVGVESAALKAAERTVKETKHAWEFTMASRTPAKVTFDYIAKTLGWTPAFKMTLLPEKKFLLTGAATVVNTGDDLKDVKCILWAGSPNIENNSSFSPMAIVKKGLAPSPQPRPWAARKSVNRAMPMIVMAERESAADGYTPSAPGVSGNMAPFDIGTFSLKKGEALVRTLCKSNGTYENLVRWQIPARQGDDGRRVWKNHGADFNNALWECLRFANPFKHPIPDTAVEIADGSRVLAQIKGSWVNAGESATWEVTRCQDVKAAFVEQEAPSSIKNRGAGLFQRVEKTPVRKRANSQEGASAAVKAGFLNGIWYRITDIKGHIQLKNFRKSPVKMVIEMDYLGEFVSASGNPDKKPLNHFGSLNPQNQLVWNITLKPGESRKLDFRYNIIINR